MPARAEFWCLVLLLTLTVLASTVAADDLKIEFDGNGKRTITRTPGPGGPIDETLLVPGNQGLANQEREKKAKKDAAKKKKKKKSEDKKKKKSGSDQATPQATPTPGSPPQPTAVPPTRVPLSATPVQNTAVPKTSAKKAKKQSEDLQREKEPTGASKSQAPGRAGTPSETTQGTTELLLTTDAIMLVLLPIALFAVLLAGILVRRTPELNHKNQVDFYRPLLERRTWWSYFCSQHLWLGVIHPCRPQCGEHHTYVLAFMVSFHGLLAAVFGNPDEILAGVIASLVAALLFRLFVLEQVLLCGDPIANGASRAKFRKTLASKSAILEAFVAAGCLPPMPKYMGRPNTYMVVVPICACNMLTKFMLDSSYLRGGATTEAFENNMMSVWWHHFVVALALDAIVVQSILSSCLVFMQTVTVARYPNSASLQKMTPPEQQALFLNMELSHPLVAGEVPAS